MIHLLDHGYLSFVEHWGSDQRIVEAARMSTNKGFLGWEPRICDCYYRPDPEDPYVTIDEVDVNCHLCGGTGQLKGDMHLLRYLYSNQHNTPFEMSGLTLVVQAPILTFREWQRHRTQSYNEMSARYEPLPDLNYIPTVERLLMNAGTTNKQAGTVKGSETLTAPMAERFRERLRTNYENDQELYEWALSMGVPKELARVHLPVGRYSRMMASANLRNWLAFLTLRQAPGAQWEIRQYANAVGSIIADRFPRTWQLFEERKQAA